MTDPNTDRLREAVRSSRLSSGAYARHVLRCDVRALRRWLDGSRPVPDDVAARIEHPPPTRTD